jgi:hypothetical protein
MNELREAFKKVKEDILLLNDEVSTLKDAFSDINIKLDEISRKIDILQNKPTYTPTHPSYETATPTHTPTVPQAIGGLKASFSSISIGNEGVPTDRQANQQTGIQQIIKQENALERAHEILDSLDSLKKEVRIKFKKLTEQEIKIFSLIYQLDADGEMVDYKLLSQRTRLSESSIRDYAHKIIQKGIPIFKEKLNNKQIILHVSQDLRKIASLDTILKLREI